MSSPFIRQDQELHAQGPPARFLIYKDSFHLSLEQYVIDVADAHVVRFSL